MPRKKSRRRVHDSYQIYRPLIKISTYEDDQEIWTHAKQVIQTTKNVDRRTNKGMETLLVSLYNLGARKNCNSCYSSAKQSIQILTQKKPSFKTAKTMIMGQASQILVEGQTTKAASKSRTLIQKMMQLDMRKKINREHINGILDDIIATGCGQPCKKLHQVKEEVNTNLWTYKKKKSK